jgi:predicted SAM-dependent methyltransferase
MADLSMYEDGSFDLVYSGQTIEHVTEDECDVVLAEVLRVLRPGGWFCVDTPNGPACRLQQPDFINPDHKVEYGHHEFVAKLRRAGFEVRTEKGLNWLGPAFALGQFHAPVVSHYVGLYGVPEECYLLAYECQKPV